MIEEKRKHFDEPWPRARHELDERLSKNDNEMKRLQTERVQAKGRTGGTMSRGAMDYKRKKKRAKGKARNLSSNGGVNDDVVFAVVRRCV